MKRNPILVVAARELRLTLRQASFWLTALLLPVALLAYTIHLERANRRPTEDTRVVAIVDHAGVFDAAVAADIARTTGPRYVPYADVSAAVADVQRGAVNVCYELGADYLDTGVLSVCSPDPARDVYLAAFLRRSLAAHAPDAGAAKLTQRLVDPIHRWADVDPDVESFRRTVVSEQHRSAFRKVFLFALIAALFGVTLGAMQTIREEKQNRMLEMSLGSLRPSQLLAGKLCGHLLAALVVAACWAPVLAWAEVQLTLSAIPFDAAQVAAILVYGLSAVAFIACAMMLVAAAARDDRASLQRMGLVLVAAFMAPVFVQMLLVTERGRALIPSAEMTAISWFPPTAPAAMLARGIALSASPTELVAAAAMMALCASLLFAAASKLLARNATYGAGVSLRSGLRMLFAR